MLNKIDLNTKPWGTPERIGSRNYKLKLLDETHMPLILQPITYMADSQKLQGDLLIVLQMLDYCQLPVILLMGGVVQYNPSENHIVILKELDP